MKRPLSRMQTAILFHIQRSNQITEKALRSSLSKSLSLAPDHWEQEYLLSVELLCLYGAMHVNEHYGKGRVFISKKQGSTTLPSLTSRKPIRFRTHRAVPVIATALLGAGCALLQPNETQQPAPRYNPDGWTVPSRIEQFFNHGKMVYRYCHEDECPSPTAKTPAIDQRTTKLMVDQGPSPAPHPAHLSQQDIQKIPLEIIAQEPKTSTPSKQPVLTAAGSETRLKLDAEFDSYQGVVGFANGSMTLDGLSRQKVAELAPMAQVATQISLRGRVGATVLTEELKKLAVGRAYAVKVEFIKHDVDQNKIRILNPRKNDLLDVRTPRASINRSVDVTFDMPSTETETSFPQNKLGEKSTVIPMPNGTSWQLSRE